MEESPDNAANVWEQLDQFLLGTWKHPSGLDFQPAVTLIDSGAHSDSVYDFVMPRQHGRRVYACKGVDYLAKPGLVAEGSTRKMNIRLFMIGTYAAKDRIFARLQIEQPGPGYLHLPEWVTDEYLSQLTGEKKIPVMIKRTRTTKRIYVKTHNRNEALDLMVYSHGALAVLQQFVAPQIYHDLGAVKTALDNRQRPESLIPVRTRRMRTPGIYSSLRVS
jgi:phage terminase large subunit GpA-like protein